jgi:hypothetical protein
MLTAKNLNWDDFGVKIDSVGTNSLSGHIELVKHDSESEATAGESLDLNSQASAAQLRPKSNLSADDHDLTLAFDDNRLLSLYSANMTNTSP